MDLTGRSNGNFTDVGELGSRLCNRDLLAVFIGHRLRVGLVRMAVDQDVDSRGIGNDASGAPALRNSLFSKMGYQNNVIRALGSRLIHALLNLIV